MASYRTADRKNQPSHTLKENSLGYESNVQYFQLDLQRTIPQIMGSIFIKLTTVRITVWHCCALIMSTLRMGPEPRKLTWVEKASETMVW